MQVFRELADTKAFGKVQLPVDQVELLQEAAFRAGGQ
jgi:hypothetical protein